MSELMLIFFAGVLLYGGFVVVPNDVTSPWSPVLQGLVATVCIVVGALMLLMALLSIAACHRTR